MKIETAEQVIRENGIVILVCSAHEQPDVSDWSEERALQQTIDSTDAWMDNRGTLNTGEDPLELDRLGSFPTDAAAVESPRANSDSPRGGTAQHLYVVESSPRN